MNLIGEEMVKQIRVYYENANNGNIDFEVFQMPDKCKKLYSLIMVETNENEKVIDRLDKHNIGERK